MSQSPYAGSMSPSGYESAAPARTSVLAVLAVVVAVLCVPGTGLLAILLGAIALAAIGRSNGRIEGRGAAISGIILGLITTVLWGAIAMGVLQGWTYYTKNMVAVGDGFFQAVAGADYDTARTHLTQEANERVPSEQFAWFVEEIEKRQGAIQGASTSLEVMFESFGEVFSSSRSGNNQQVSFNDHDNNDVPAPVAIQCANGSIVAWIIFDGDSLDDVANSPPLIEDVLIQFPGDEYLTLQNDGPAADQAARSGMLRNGESIENDAGPPSPEPESDFPTPDPPQAPSDDPSTS